MRALLLILTTLCLVACASAPSGGSGGGTAYQASYDARLADKAQFGRVVIGGFLETTLRGREEYREMFRDHRAAGDWLPPTMYMNRYADANTKYLATFEEDVDLTTGAVPGVRIAA